MQSVAQNYLANKCLENKTSVHLPIVCIDGAHFKVVGAYLVRNLISQMDCNSIKIIPVVGWNLYPTCVSWEQLPDWMSCFQLVIIDKIIGKDSV